MAKIRQILWIAIMENKNVYNLFVIKKIYSIFATRFAKNGLYNIKINNNLCQQSNN